MAESSLIPPEEAQEFLFFRNRTDTRRTIVQTQDVRKVYKMGKIEVHALRGVGLSIFEGEFMAIMGPSGSGKSTFFNMIGGLDKPSGGKVFIDEVDIAQLDAYELAWLRCRKIGYIFQSFNLIPVMTCVENVMLPMTFAGVPGEEAFDRSCDILRQVGLGHRLTHKPPQMSGGQQQRIAVARALANQPAILLADEPTANLDSGTGQEIIDLLVGLCRDLGVTVICATHDMKMLDKCDRVVWIRDGRCDRIEDRANIEIQVGEMSHGERKVLIHTEEVTRHYKLGDETVKALDGITADIYEGEFLSIMGPSGSGKSTFFNMIGGLDQPTGGKIYMNGADISTLSERQQAFLRCHNIGYIFQTFNLIPVMSACENVSLPLIFSGIPIDEAEAKAAETLASVGLGDRVHHHPFELSGGQQRVAVARALANDPKLILADEPTGNLDLKTGQEIINLLNRLKVEKGVTIISATHDMKMLSNSDRVLWILDGKVDKIMDREDLEIHVGTMDGHELA